MNVPKKLQTLIDKILELNHSKEEWLRLEKEAKAYLKELSPALRTHFAESGAGEALYMVCSGIKSRK